MTRVRNILPQNVMLMLYYTLIYPYLTYCCIVWGTAKFSVINKVQVLQKRAVRLCTGSDIRASSSPLFKRLRLLKINDINKLQTVVFMQRVKCGLLPVSCLHHVTISDNKDLYNTRNKSFFKLKAFRTNIRENSLAIRGPKLWNLLPVDIKTSYCVETVKKKFIAYCLDLY